MPHASDWQLSLSIRQEGGCCCYAAYSLTHEPESSSLVSTNTYKLNRNEQRIIHSKIKDVHTYTDSSSTTSSMTTSSTTSTSHESTSDDTKPLRPAVDSSTVRFFHHLDLVQIHSISACISFKEKQICFFVHALRADRTGVCPACLH